MSSGAYAEASVFDVIDPTSQPDQIQSLLQELSNETSDLPVERRERVEAALQKIQSCFSALASTDGKEALAVGEVKYRELAEIITDPFTVWDATLRMVYRNKASAETTRIPDEQALGKTFSEIYPSLAGGEVHQVYLRALATHQPQRIQLHWVRPSDGMGFYYDLSIYPTSTGLLAFSKDVTDQVQAKKTLFKSNEAIRLSEEKFAKAFHYNPAAMTITRVSDGRYLDANESFCKMTGYSREELIGHTSVELGMYSEETRQAVIRTYRETGQFRQQEFALTSRNGEQYVISFSMDPIEVNGEPCNLATMIDITARKRVEAALEKANLDLITEQNRLLAVLEALPVGVVILDSQGGILQANREYEVVWGGPPPITQSAADYAAYYQAWWANTGVPLKPEEWAAAQAVQKGEPVTGQILQIQRFDGRQAYVLNSGAPIRDAKGEIVGSTVVVMNITQLVEAEFALRETQDRFRVAVSTGPLMVYTCDREQRYTWIYNPLRGFRSEDVLGKRDDELLPPQSAAELIAAKQMALETGQGRMQEVKVPSNGEDRYYILTTDPIRDPQGNVTGLTCSAIDITEQKRLQRVQQEQAIQIEVQGRLMEQREQDRHSIARDLHDGPIQTLSSTLFQLHMIKEVFPDPALEKELGQLGLDIKDTIQALRDLLKELRPPALIQFGFSKVARMFLEDFRDRYPGIEIELELVEKDTFLSNDTHLTLFRIFQAGINNILRHSDASKAWVVFKIEQDCFLLEIRDNGKGFELPEDFSQLPRHGHYGLVGMKERAEAIGAEFSVSSIPGKGTTIRINGSCLGKNLR